MRSFLGLFFILTTLPSRGSDLAQLVNSKSWESYMRCLSYFQKYSPASYFPPELIRFDRLPISELDLQVQKYSSLWLSAFKYGNSNNESHLKKLSVSKEANWALYLLLQKNLDKVPIYGSRADLLDKIPKESRLALTPLDASFKINTFSKELNKNLSIGGVKSWNSFSIDLKEKRIQLEISPGLDQARISYPVAIIESKNNSNLNNTYKVRTPASLNSIPDLRVDTNYLQGNFFNNQSKDSTPFGKYINESDTFIDENGQQHFGGDGHNHGHGHKH